MPKQRQRGRTEGAASAWDACVRHRQYPLSNPRAWGRPVTGGTPTLYSRRVDIGRAPTHHDPDRADAMGCRRAVRPSRATRSHPLCRTTSPAENFVSAWRPSAPAATSANNPAPGHAAGRLRRSRAKISVRDGGEVRVIDLAGGSVDGECTFDHRRRRSTPTAGHSYRPMPSPHRRIVEVDISGEREVTAHGSLTTTSARR